MSKLIDVDRLKKDILALPDCYNGFSDTYDKACIIGVIDEQPTIEERKTGMWIVYKAPDKYHCGLCKCPFCGEEMIAESDEYNFCPNCGADMRESHCDDCRFYDEECVYCPVKQERREK